VNDQGYRARGPMRLNVEQPKSVSEGEDVEKPKNERAPVQRLVMWPFREGAPVQASIHHRRGSHQGTNADQYNHLIGAFHGPWTQSREYHPNGQQSVCRIAGRSRPVHSYM